MRARALMCSVFAIVGIFRPTLAQRPNVANANGAWQQTEIRSQRPDSTVTRPASAGIRIIYNGHFSQIFYPSNMAQQAARPSTAEEKAARYDAVTANAGHFEMTDDSTWVVHFDFAKGPSTIGAKATARYRIVADTLWETTTAPWSKDSTKTVRTTSKFVRLH